MTVSPWLMVALGGLVGAPSRYLVDRFVTGRYESALPWGTFIVNVTGTFLLGLLTGVALNGRVPAVTQTLVGTGFCGAYTTFSTFSFETVRLIESGRLLEATANTVASALVGLAGAGCGVALGLLA